MDDSASKRTVWADEVIDIRCVPICGVGCQTSVSVKDGTIVKIDGRERAGQ